MADDIAYLSATELAARYRRRELSPVEAVDALLARIERFNPAVNAFVTVLGERAREQAKQSERRLAAGEPLGVLDGVPVAVKDLFDTIVGVRNTFGSRAFADFEPPETATYVSRLEAAGAVVLGKTNTPEFGHKGITDNPLFGPTRCPFDLRMNAGGSSGGSAAALAAGMCPLAQGSDAGGSIRIPAAMCGVVGLKASYGRVPAKSRPNAFLSHTPFIHAGPMARTIADTALMLAVMAGPDDRDPMSLPDDGRDFVAAVTRPIRGWRVAFSADFGVFAVDRRVDAVVRDAVRAFADAGARVEETSVGIAASQRELADLWVRQIAVLYAEMDASLKAAGVDLLRDHEDDLTPAFARMIEQGHGIRAVDRQRDEWVRSQVFDAVQDVFERYDLLVTPTVSVPYVENAADGQTTGPTSVAGREVEPQIGWCMTHPVNYTGHPAISVPAGLTDEGHPIGLQIIGRRFADDEVIAAASAFEQARPWTQGYRGLEQRWDAQRV